MRRIDAASEPAMQTPSLHAGHGEPIVLLGSSAAARRLAADIDAAARASCAVVEGDAGLDLVDVARAIHARSARQGVCVEVQCASAEPALIERELVGDGPRRGAGDLESIDARSALARARGGTLYLADVAELSAAAQARLARVARDGEVRIGREPSALGLSLLAGASTDLEGEVNEGRLRRDLLRQLSRARVVVPVLRRRAEDIPLMIESIVGRLCAASGVPRKSLTQAALTLLTAMPWRGNLSELRHALARLVASAPADSIQLEDVLAHVRFEGALAPHAPAGTLRSARQQFERDYIALVLRHHRGHVGEAARALGIQRTNLYRKARQLGISVARPVRS
jgi:two-component system nitrogen regulation response regulator NtrX